MGRPSPTREMGEDLRDGEKEKSRTLEVSCCRFLQTANEGKGKGCEDEICCHM